MGPSDIFTNDIGGTTINLSDGGDDLGLNMLANTGRSNQQKQFTINTSGPPSGLTGGGVGLSEIEVNSFEPVEPITLNLGGPSFGSSAPIEIQFSKSDNERSSGPSESGLFSNSQTSSGPFSALSPAPAPRMSPEEEKKEKMELITKLQRLEQKGLPVSRRYTMDNTLEEIKQEYARLVDARNLETSIRFQRQMLVGAVTGLQWMNDRFDPFDIKLDGWSESVHEGVEDFDEIFEELYDKYKEKGKMPPEARLIMSLAGSGFMCHISNTFLRSRMPSMDDVLRQNPEIAKQFAAAAAKSAGPGFGNFMSMAMGAEPAPQASPAGAFFGANGSAPPMAQMPQPVAAMEPRATARREMKGPSGVDDILRTFEEVRRNDMDGLNGPSMNGVPPSEMQPAMSASIEMQSVGGDDIGSVADSARTGMSANRRGRRRTTNVTGNTLSLNV